MPVRRNLLRDFTRKLSNAPTGVILPPAKKIPYCLNVMSFHSFSIDIMPHSSVYDHFLLVVNSRANYKGKKIISITF